MVKNGKEPENLYNLLVAATLEKGNYLRFCRDSGSQCGAQSAYASALALLLAQASRDRLRCQHSRLDLRLNALVHLMSVTYARLAQW